MYKFASAFIVISTLTIAWGGSPELTWQSTWNRGHYLQVTYTENQLLVAMYENGLDVLAPSAGSPIQHMSRLSFGTEQPRFLMVEDRLVYVLTEKRVVLVDFSRPYFPEIISEVPDVAVHAHLEDTTLFLFGNKITRWDMTDPLSPQLLFENRLQEPLRAGFILENQLVTISQSGVIDISNMEDDGSLVSQLEETLVPPGPADIVTYHENRIYFGKKDYQRYDLEQGIHGYQIQSGNQVTFQGTVYPGFNIEDLAISEDRLIAAGNSYDFEGLIFFELDFENHPFQRGNRLSKGPFSAIHPVNRQLFFGISDERGLEQFRPETSYSITSSSRGLTLAQDVAFKDPFMFLASPGKLEVLSFQDPKEPVFTGFYPNETQGDQKLHLRDDVLYLANDAGVMRFRVGDAGSLSEMDPLLQTEIPGPILAMTTEADQLYLATADTFMAISENGLKQQDFPRFNSIHLFNTNQVIIKPPHVLKRSRTTLEFFELDPTSVITPIYTQHINRITQPRPYPTTWNGHLLLAGPYVYDTKNFPLTRTLPRVDIQLEDTTFADDLLFGVGSNGLEIWDFKRPETPKVLYENPDFKGDRLFVEGDALVIFRESPNEISYFTYQEQGTEFIFPYLENGFPGSEQLVFHNPSESEATIHLSTRSHGQTDSISLDIPPFATQTFDTQSLFPDKRDLTITLRAPRALKTSYLRKGSFSFDANVSPSLTSPFATSELSNQITLHIPSAPQENTIAIASPDSEAEFDVQLKFVADDGSSEEKTVRLQKNQTILSLVHDIFGSVQPSQSGGIIATAPEGTQIAGMVFAGARMGTEAAAKAFPAEAQTPNPFRVERQARLDFGDRFDHLDEHLGDLILSGQSGLLLVPKNGENRRFNSEHNILDAALDDQYIWALTSKSIDLRRRSDGQILHQLANTIGANHLRRQGNTLLLWHEEKPHIQVINTLESEMLEANPALSLHGAWPTDALLLQGQLFISTNHGLQVYSEANSSESAYLGRLMPNAALGLLSTDESSLFVQFDQKMLEWQPNPQDLPTFLLETGFSGELLSLVDDKALLYSNRRSFRIRSFKNPSESHSLSSINLSFARAATFSDSRLWVNTLFNGLYEYDIGDSSDSPLLRHVEQTVSYDYLAEADSRIFATSYSNLQLSVHELSSEKDQWSLASLPLGIGFSSGIVAKGDHVYISDSQQGLITVHFDQEFGPKLVGKVPGSCRGIAGDDNLLVTTDRRSFSVFNLADSAIPKLTSITVSERIIRDMTLDGNLLLVTEDPFGLGIYDLSEPHAPKKISQLRIPQEYPFTYIDDVVFFNKHAYVVYGSYLYIVDYHDPVNPQLVGRFPAFTTGIHVVDNHLFLRNDNDTDIFDLTNPRRPQHLSRIENLWLFSFTGNNQSLWTMGLSSLQSIHLSPLRATIPWVVHNQKYQTQIQISNTSDETQLVQLKGVDTAGQVEETSLSLPPQSIRNFAGQDLFPDMTGYALSLETPSSQVNASFSTVTSSDSETEALAQTIATPSRSLRDGLILNFPTTSTAAFVIVAPFNHLSLPVRVELHGPDGFLDETTVTLEKNQPSVQLVASLFPQLPDSESFTVIIKSANGTVLTGTTYLFDEQGLPAQAESFPESTLFLKSSPKQP